MADLLFFDLETTEGGPFSADDILNLPPVQPPKPDPAEIENDTEREQPSGDDVEEIDFILPEQYHGLSQTIAQPISIGESITPPAFYVGLLKFRNAQGENRRGSAFKYLKSTLIMTAAHCVHSGGSRGRPGAMFTDIQYLGFGPGNSQVDVPKKIAVPDGWVNNSSYSADYAFLFFDQPVYGAPGGLGGIYNLPVGQTYTAYGWPAEAPFNSRLKYKANGPNFIGGHRGNPMGMQNNDMSGGSSGGPWLADGHGNMANGLNSFAYDHLPDIMYGPYFGKDVARHSREAINVQV